MTLTLPLCIKRFRLIVTTDHVGTNTAANHPPARRISPSGSASRCTTASCTAAGRTLPVRSLDYKSSFHALCNKPSVNKYMTGAVQLTLVRSVQCVCSSKPFIGLKWIMTLDGGSKPARSASAGSNRNVRLGSSQVGAIRRRQRESCHGYRGTY